MNNIFINCIVGKLASFQKNDAGTFHTTVDTLFGKEEKKKPAVTPKEISYGSSSICSELSFDYLPDDADEESSDDIFAAPYYYAGDFHVLKDGKPTSWSVQVLDKNIRPGDTLWFCLFCNDAKNGAMYLEGDEIISCINAILGHGQVLAFYVHFARCGSFVHLSKGDIRTFLKRTLHHAKHAHSGAQLVRDLRNKRTAQALTTRALYPERSHRDDDVGILSFPDMFFRLHYGKTLREMKEETEAEEAAEKAGSPTRPRSPPTPSHYSIDNIQELLAAAAMNSNNNP